jgi:hypothetical protein
LLKCFARVKMGVICFGMKYFAVVEGSNLFLL